MSGESSQPHIYKFSVNALTNQERADTLTNLVRSLVSVDQVDINVQKRLMRIVSELSVDIHQLKMTLSSHGFHLQKVTAPPVHIPQSSTSSLDVGVGAVTLTVGVSGMTCRSCELTIERAWKKLSGVMAVHVNAASGQARLVVEGHCPSITQLQRALGIDGTYVVHHSSKKYRPVASHIQETRPSFWRLVGLFGFVFLLGRILASVGLFKTSFSIGSGMNFGAIIVVGLVAASSSCIAISGGLLLSSAAKFNERYGSERPLARMRPVFLFVLGRIVSYTFFGGVLGLVGAALRPSPTVTAVIAIAAALYMLTMGLDMLHIAPAWLKNLMPRMPKSLSHKIMDAEGKEHPLAPFGLGAATFFLPCGFTQALQLYALTTNSMTAGALTLLPFALGTAPALLALGWASSSLKGAFGRLFFQFSGALVVVLGFWNIQNGLGILGYPIRFPGVGDNATVQAANTGGGALLSGTMEGKTQVIRMGASRYGYSPNQFTLRAGVPVRWEVDGANAGGCVSVLISRQLGVQTFLQPGKNVIQFTPSSPGQIAFSCGMGMYRGSFTVLPAT